MSLRTIKGLTKKEFIESCYELATKENPNWMMDDFKTDRFDDSWVWVTKASNSGFAVSKTGMRFLTKSLKIKPYIIEANPYRMLGSTIVKLDRYMPWPYRMEHTVSGVIFYLFSSEVAVWAAMYDNDINKLLDIYEQSTK